MDTYPYLDDDLAYWTQRLEAAETDLRTLTQDTLTTPEQLKTQMSEVNRMAKAVRWRMKLKDSLAARAASARIAQDAGLRRSARIAARARKH